MPICVKFFSWLLSAAALSAVAAQQVDAQPPSAGRHAPSKIGGVPVADLLQRLGAKLERGSDSKTLDDYSNHFDRTDPNRDGKHTREEYVDKGGYMTPQARAGIFRAADGNADGVVTKAEYILNRIITDEAKAIVQGMDDDKDSLVERAEFVKHSTTLFSDRELAERVFDAFDVNADGEIPIPEYLRVWGQWARAGRKSAEDRIAVRRAKLAKVAKELGNRYSPGYKRPGGFVPFGRQGGVRPREAGLGRLAASELEIGKPFPSITIVDANGRAFSIKQLKGNYTVLVAGCLTCPAFLGTYPGSEFVLDPEGCIVHMQMWSNPDRLRAVLEKHVGRVEKPTTVAELEGGRPDTRASCFLKGRGW